MRRTPVPAADSERSRSRSDMPATSHRCFRQEMVAQPGGDLVVADAVVWKQVRKRNDSDALSYAGREIVFPRAGMQVAIFP